MPTLGQYYDKARLANLEATQQNLYRCGKEAGLLRGVVTLNLLALEVEELAELLEQENRHAACVLVFELARKIREEARVSVLTCRKQQWGFDLLK